MVRDLFAPSVTVGLLKPADLAGYRNGQVYIRKSMHVPLAYFQETSFRTAPEQVFGPMCV